MVKSINMEEHEIVGVGNTATVYKWGDNKVLKLFNLGYPEEAILKEFKNAQAIGNKNFSKPKVHQIVNINKRTGIVYEKVCGESLEEWVLRTGDLEKCATIMADLHKDILSNTIHNVPNYKRFLESHIANAINIDQKESFEGLKLLDKLDNGSILCHGDFHPGNIFISEEDIIAIDFMNVCRGSFLYDVARTAYLLEYTPVPLEIENREIVKKWKKQITDHYLEEMNVSRDMISDYIKVISVARKGECPDENRLISITGNP